ncbi:MAG: hypothetical protein ACLR2G_09040 [Phascolarctobacterium faecium]
MTVVYTSKELTAEYGYRKLCCRMSLIIAEPDLKQRLAQENGTYDLGSCLPIKMAVAGDGRLPSSWQIYVVSKAWQQFLQQPEEKVLSDSCG